MPHRFPIAAFFLLLGTTNSPLSAMAGEHTDTLAARTFASDAADFVDAAGHGFASPGRWNAGDLKTFGIVLLFTTGALLLDDEVRDVLLRNEASGLGETLIDVGFQYGKPGLTSMGALGFYGAGTAFGSSWARETGIMILENVVVAGLTQQTLRVMVGRARPKENLGNHDFEPFTTDDRFASFISGHAAMAFGTSTVLARQIDNTWASVGLYALAALTPISRVYTDRHWFSDALMGSALGYFTANTVVNWHRRHPHFSDRFSILPTGNGFAATLRF
jgi:membrane-associated phospholipid phosphatase